MTKFRMRTKPEEPERIEDMYIFLMRIPQDHSYPPYKKYKVYSLEHASHFNGELIETERYNYEFEQIRVPIDVVAKQYIEEWAIKLKVNKENIHITKHSSRYGDDDGTIDYYGLMYVGTEPECTFKKRLEKYEAEIDGYNKWQKENADKIKDYHASKQNKKKQSKIKRVAALEAELEKLKKETKQSK